MKTRTIIIITIAISVLTTSLVCALIALFSKKDAPAAAQVAASPTNVPSYSIDNPMPKKAAAPTLVIMTKGELQSKAKAYLAENGNIMNTLKISNPQFTLTEGQDRIGVKVDIDVSLLGKEMKGNLSGSGKIGYSDGTVYLEDLKFEAPVLEGVSKNFTGPATRIVEDLLVKYLPRIEVYTLGDSVQERSARAIMKDLKVKNDTIIAQF